MKANSNDDKFSPNPEEEKTIESKINEELTADSELDVINLYDTLDTQPDTQSKILSNQSIMNLKEQLKTLKVDCIRTICTNKFPNLMKLKKSVMKVSRL